MDDVKLLSRAVFLFSILITIGFFQYLKQDRMETIKTVSTLEFGSVDEDIPHKTIPNEKTTVISSNVHSSSSFSLEFSRQAVCLFAILFRKEIDFNFYQFNNPVPLVQFFAVLLVTVISPNAP